MEWVTLVILSFLALAISISEGAVGGNPQKDLILSADEKAALDKFKPSVLPQINEEFMKSDFYLIRWLRKTSLHIPTARDLLTQTIRWRNDNNMSRILSEDWSDLEDDYPLDFDAHDINGRPVLIMNFGEWDLRAATLQGKMRRLRRYLTYATERNIHNIFVQQASGIPVTRAVILIDADGINIRHHGCPSCLALLVHSNIETDAYFPSFIEETIAINVPAIGAVIMNALRSVPLSATSTFRVFDSNKQIWMKYLDERIERSERSPRYGGYRE